MSSMPIQTKASYLFDNLCLHPAHSSDEEQAGGQQPLPGSLASTQLGDGAKIWPHMWGDLENDRQGQVTARVYPCAV